MFRSLDIRRPAAFILGLLTLASVPATAQESGEEQETFINATDHPLLKTFRWRSIGPVGQGGRVAVLYNKEIGERCV